MADYKTIRDQIVSVATGAGLVPASTFYGRVRVLVDQRNFLAAFENANIINGGYVTLRAIDDPGNEGGVSLGQIGHRYRYEIHLYYSVQDGSDSETTFVQLAEAVLLALQQKKTYGDANVVTYTTHASMPVVDIRNFNSALVHHAEIRLELEVPTGATWT